MSTRDPFLAAMGIVLDRALVFLMLASVSAAVLWDAVWERGMGRSGGEAWTALRALLTGRADRTTAALFALTVAVAVLGTGLLCAGLFARWRRAGDLSAERVRGTRNRDSTQVMNITFRLLVPDSQARVMTEFLARLTPMCDISSPLRSPLLIISSAESK